VTLVGKFDTGPLAGPLEVRYAIPLINQHTALEEEDHVEE
jgi:hypothetical protein